MKVAALKVQYRETAGLQPYLRNARQHPAEQVALIAQSIQRYGFNNPILVDGASGVIAGHGRLAAAVSLGLAQVPVIELSHLSARAKREFILADNKLAERAGWDATMLALEAGDLRELGADLGVLGFDAAELGALFAPPNPGKTDPEATPAPPANPVTRPGDLWKLGRHRILCGDSTIAANVERLLAGARPHLMVTDPPYGVEYDANWRNERVRGDGSPSDGRATGKVLNDDRADWREAWALFTGDVAYVWCASLRVQTVAESLLASGFELRSQIIWAKQQFAIGRSDYHWQHEPCWYAVRKSRTGHWAGDRKQTTLWQIDKPRKSETGHSTQKPVECMRRPIENNSAPGDAVYEPFSGSGTTIIAAEMTGRSCYAIELSPAYVDVAVRRWEEFTGLKAERETEHGPARPKAKADSDKGARGKSRAPAAASKRTEAGARNTRHRAA